MATGIRLEVPKTHMIPPRGHRTAPYHHARLMLRLRSEIDRNEYKTIKSTLQAYGKLNRAQAEELSDFPALWNTLSDNGQIRIGDYTTLKEILSAMNLAALVKIIEDSEKEIGEALSMPCKEAEGATEEDAIVDETDSSTNHESPAKAFLSKKGFEDEIIGNQCSACSNKDTDRSWASHICQDCHVLVCRACVKAAHKTHKTRAVAMCWENPKFDSCPVAGHGRRQFCLECDVFVCHVCGSDHTGHQRCSFQDAVVKVCKDMEVMQTKGDQMLSKVKQREREAEAALTTHKWKGDGVILAIEQSAKKLVDEIEERKNELIKEMKRFSESHIAQHVSVNKYLRQKFETSMLIGQKLLSDVIVDDGRLRLVRDIVKDVENSSKASEAVAQVGADTFPYFVDCAKPNTKEKLGYLKPFSLATRVDEFIASLPSPCFFYSAAILDDDHFAAMLGTTPDSYSGPRRVYIINRKGNITHIIKSKLGDAVDMVAYKGQLAILRREEPYIVLMSIDGAMKTLELLVKLVEPSSIAVDQLGRFIITHAPGDRSTPESILVVRDTKVIATGDYFLGRGRISCGNDIMFGYNSEISRYCVNRREVVQTKSGQHGVKDFSINGIKTCEGDVFAIGATWFDVRLYQVVDKTSETKAWDLTRVPLLDSAGDALEITDYCGTVCFDIKENDLLLGYTDKDERGFLFLFKLGPI